MRDWPWEPNADYTRLLSALRRRGNPCFVPFLELFAGAQELDMVMNIGALRSGRYDYVEKDIRAVVKAAGEGVIVKVILENCYLTDEEKVKACRLAKAAGAHFAKTSTGFAAS
jgi:deoxyribose-phosphate aldolase